MTSQKNIGHLILKSLSENSDRIAFISNDRIISYKEFKKIIGAICLNLSASGLRRGGLLGIASSDPRVVVASAVSAQLLGAAWIEVNSQSLSTNNFKITHIISDSVKKILPKDRKVIIISGEWFEDERLDNWEQITPIFGFGDDKKISRVMQSSGTTGRRKFILSSVDNEYKRIIVKPSYIDHKEIRMSCLFGPSTLAGYNARVKNILCGGVNIESDINSWYENGVDAVLGSPEQFRKIFDQQNFHETQGLLENAIIVGATPHEELLSKMLKTFEQVVIGYGSTELGLIGTKNISNINDLHKDYHIINDKTISLEVVDGRNKILPKGVAGILRLQNDLGRPIYSERKLNKKSNWFYPGDQAIKKDKTRFQILDRIDDILNIGGKKISLAPIDYLVQNIPQVNDGFCFSADGEGGIGVIVNLKKNIDKKSAIFEIKSILQQQKMLRNIPIKLILTNQVPRTPTGKAKRNAAKSLISGKMQ